VTGYLSAFAFLSLAALLVWVGVKLNDKSRFLEARRRWLDAREADLDARGELLDARERTLSVREAALGLEKQVADLTITGLAARMHFQPDAKEVA
jgi:hypothetical protein